MSEVYFILTAGILQSMIGVCCDKTYGAMTNHYNEDDNGDNNGNEDENDDDNATFGSGSDGPIFDPIVMPRSCLGLAEEYRVTMATDLWLWFHMYLCVGI